MKINGQPLGHQQLFSNAIDTTPLPIPLPAPPISCIVTIKDIIGGCSYLEQPSLLTSESSSMEAS